MHWLAVLPGGRQAGVLRRPVARRANDQISWHGVGADQALVVRMLQGDAVQYHGGVAVVGELLKAECLRLATGHADLAVRDPAVHATAQQAVSGLATAATAPA